MIDSFRGKLGENFNEEGVRQFLKSWGYLVMEELKRSEELLEELKKIKVSSLKEKLDVEEVLNLLDKQTQIIKLESQLKKIEKGGVQKKKFYIEKIKLISLIDSLDKASCPLNFISELEIIKSDEFNIKSIREDRKAYEEKKNKLLNIYLKKEELIDVRNRFFLLIDLSTKDMIESEVKQKTIGTQVSVSSEEKVAVMENTEHQAVVITTKNK